MYKGLFVDRPEHAVLRKGAEKPLAATEVRIRTTLAAMKHGTLFHLFSGKSPFNSQQFDPQLRMFVPKKAATPALVGAFLGNMFAGKIVEVGAEVKKLRPGDMVFGYGPACELLTRPATAVTRLPARLSAEDAVCLDPALFAYAAVRDGKIGVGDNVVLFGLGAIGLFGIQLLRLNGCLNIIAVDPIEKRRRLARKFGATHTLDPRTCDVGARIREILGVGADVAIEASGNYRALGQAIRAVRQCGRVVTLGYYKGKDSELELGAEWLHNRLEMICSLPDWNNPLREYPVWDRDRMWRTLIALFERKRLVSRGVMDPVVPLRAAPRTFMSIYKNPGQAIKMGVRFPK